MVLWRLGAPPPVISAVCLLAAPAVQEPSCSPRQARDHSRGNGPSIQSGRAVTVARSEATAKV